jgi:hypothetical protein
MNIKVYIPENEFNSVVSGQRPTRYWTDRPNLQNIISVEVSASAVKGWGSPAPISEHPAGRTGQRNLLND